MTLVHWDDVEGCDVPDRFAPLGGHWQRLADAAGSVRVGAHRVLLAAGQMITPPHVHSAEEEIFHVLAGSATLWQDGSTCIVGSGDTIVCLPGGPAHTLIGGDDGLDVLIFGTRVTTESAFLPRTRQAWLADQGVKVIDGTPWDAEAALGIPDGEPGERPANVVALDDVEGDFGGIVEAARRSRRRDALRAEPGRAAAERRRRAAALPLRRGRGLRDPRRRGHARALGPAEARASRRRRAGRAASGRQGPRRLPAGGNEHLPLLPRGPERPHLPGLTARKTRTTSPTTRARTRSSSAGSA